MKRAFYVPAGLLAALLLFFCQSPEDASGKTYLNVAGDSAYLDYSRLWVALIDSTGRDTTVLFNDSLKSLEQLKHLNLERAPEGKVRLVILGFTGADPSRPAFEEERTFDAVSDSLLSNTVPLDERRGISRPPRIESLTTEAGVKVGDTLRARARVEDPDGRIVAVRWFFDGDSIADRSDSADTAKLDPSAVWVYRSAGAREVILEATDNTGNRVRKSLPIAILPEGRPSIAFAYRDTTVTIRDSLAFAAFVMDSNGTVASYAWDPEGKGRFQPALVLDKDSDTLRIGKRFPDTGTYAIGLRIVDNDRKDTRDSALVHVMLDAPYADAGPDTSVIVGDSVFLHGRAKDGLGRLVRIEWSLAGGPFKDAEKDIAFAAPQDSGAWPCILRVTDDDGLAVLDTAFVRTAYSDNAFLAELAPASGMLVPSFSRTRADYALNVPYAVSNLAIKMRPENPHARLSVSGKTIPAGDTIAQAPLLVGSNVIPIGVLAQDGRTGKTYTLTVTRGRNVDAALKSLSMSVGTLSPSFSPDTQSYQLTLRHDQPFLSLTPTARDDANARIQVQGEAVKSGSASGNFSVPVGVDTLKIEVIAQDEAYSRVYLVVVTRLPSADASLASLSVSAGTLVPGFADTVHAYSVEVGNAVAGMAFRATAANAQAKPVVAGAAATNGAWSDTLPLSIGDNAIDIKVVAENGDTGTYSILVHRRSADANLVSLTVSRGTLVPAFTAGDSIYSATILDDSLTVSAQADPSAKMVQIVLDSPRVAGTSPMPFAIREGDQTIRVTVTAEERNTRTYTVKVHRISRDTSLAALAANKGILSPDFHAGTKAYALVLANSDSMPAFKARPGNAMAKLFLGSVPLEADSFSIAQHVPAGNTVFRVVVRAESGDSGIYSVTARRKSTIADLKALRVSRGKLAPAFNSGISGYTDTVSAASLTLTAVAMDGNAESISIGATTNLSDSATVTVPLAMGANPIAIKVKAEDGNEKTYTLNVWRRIFWKTFGGTEADAGTWVQETSAGGFIVTGSVGLPQNYRSNVYLAQTDAQGNKRNELTFGTQGENSGNCVQQTSDGGFVVTGKRIMEGLRGWDVFLLRTDADIFPLPGWPKAIGGGDGDYEFGYSVKQTTDGGFVITGHQMRSGTVNINAYLLRTDVQGFAQSGWPRSFGSYETDIGYDVQQTSDGGFVVIGQGDPSMTGVSEVFLLRTDAQGNALSGWPKHFGRGIGYSVIQTSDGGFVVAGSSSGTLLLKMDAQGSVLSGWRATSLPGEFRSVQQTRDGGLVAAGMSAGDVIILRTDAEGNPLPGWPKKFGGAGTEIGMSVMQTRDGGFIVAGTTNSEGAGGNDIFLLRLDADGNPQ